MDINTEPEEKPTLRTTIQPPPDYTSRATRIKLFVLVGSLMLVLVMMNEARKPDNWKWMGFDKDGKQTQPEKQPDYVIQEQQYEPREPDPKESQDSSDSEASEFDTSAADAPEQDPSSGSVRLIGGDFWNRLYRQLDLDEQRGLFAQLRALRNQSFPRELEFARGDLVAKMDSLIKNHRIELLNELSLIEENDPRRERLNTELQQFQQQWELQLQPTLSGDANPPSSTQIQYIQALQQVMDAAAYSVVTDKSAPTWASDDPAWLRTWERLDQAPVEEPPVVSPIQLMAESKFYRGKLINIRGELRGIEVLPTRNSPMGIDQYYSAWIRPEKTSIRPFNVYLKELPEGIEVSGKRFTPFESIELSVVGAFFKVRTYKDAGGEVSQAPLVFGRSVSVSVMKPSEVAIPVRGGWTPTRWQLILFLIAMPAVAIGIAFFTYRGTASRKYHHGAQATSRINESLGELGDDPSVKTVKERLAGMENEGLA